MTNSNCYCSYVAIRGPENHCARPTAHRGSSTVAKAAICFFVVTPELRNWCHDYMISVSRRYLEQVANFQQQ